MRIALFLLAALCVGAAQARPIATASQNGIYVVLYDEPCNLEVKLPYRITWREQGKTFEGCFGVHPGIGAVVAYFDDKSVALFSVQDFKLAREL